ncbi:MAG: hypothetical protein KKG47_06705 [Proteobacteria bacterium]|nr:hypothetical protein [Pseudomonadota bacterium]MBU1739736.1 hypothetical protein [Pseudomonadota bacterium]
MHTRHDDQDGSNIFWPGYVDATTNLVLNLLFLLTIMIVAVFMFALELGRTSKVETVTPPAIESTENAGQAAGAAIDLSRENEELKREIEQLKLENAALKRRIEELEKENKKLRLEIEELKKKLALLAPDEKKSLENLKAIKELTRQKTDLESEIQRLKKLQLPKTSLGGSEKNIEATSALPKPQYGLDKTLESDFEVMVRFKDKAIAFTEEEHAQLLDSLKPLVERGGAIVFVEVPTGFSEAKRMGFYRAMAVRNILIEMNMAKENIEVLVVDGNSNAKASQVKVRAR